MGGVGEYVWVKGAQEKGRIKEILEICLVSAYVGTATVILFCRSWLTRSQDGVDKVAGWV